MLYPYMTLADGTEVCHTHLLEDGTVEVHFEQPIYRGFKSARCRLPDYTWLFQDGFSPEEQREMEDFLRHNAHLFFKFAARGGISCA
jgi:hypothetical protein